MRYVAQRYRVRPEDGSKFILLRAEHDDPQKAEGRRVALAAEDPASEHEVVIEPDAAVPPYVAPPVPTPEDPQVAAD